MSRGCTRSVDGGDPASAAKCDKIGGSRSIMAQMTPEVAKLLQQALSLSVEEQEALADSLISNLGGKVDEGVLAAWDEEIKKRIADLDSGKASTIPWTKVRQRNLAKLPSAH